MGMIQIPKNSIIYFKEHLDEIFETGSFAEGPWNKKLSNYVKTLTGAGSALPTNSNGAGMVALLSIYRHYHDRKTVMFQSNTMYGVKTMVAAGGCNLAGYIQCQLDTLMPSFEDVQNTISPLSIDEKDDLIILLSHIGGIVNPDIESIAALCKKENIILLEDCAHSFGAILYGKHSGLFGNAGVYSFYATKAIPVGEGGVVVTNDQELGDMVAKYSIYDRFDQQLEVGSNIRISEVQALLTYSVVKECKTIVDNKRLIAEKYMDACKKNNIDYIAQDINGHEGNYYKFVVFSRNVHISESLPNLKTTTSPVYDYSIGTPNPLAQHHACLPIWFKQDETIYKKVISELTSTSSLKTISLENYK